ncbi:hypothetical protein C2G38_1733149 [Gigaspora rosea]|uniref:Uncharacterized protein n=1 Tax=Gigaspora rosea TaxID=44941 RepID=A0A397UTB6_9GLOM|nr:hypothetical protein C2G38_1733149 [Gigaspora rosea]
MIPPPPPPIPLKKNNSNAHVSSQKRKKISNGKKKSYKKSIQTTNSSAISDLSNANVYKPEHYWNDRAKEWSEKLWLPIMNDYAGMVREVVVTHHERLCRFAYGLLKYVFSLQPTKLMVLFNDSTTNNHELSEHILATSTVFIYRKLYRKLYRKQGSRTAMHRRKKKKKILTVRKNKKRKHDESVDRTLNVKLYSNLAQKRLLKR